MQLLDGVLLSKTIKQELKEAVQEYKKKGFRPPHLAAILVGDNGASKTYIASKIKSCEQSEFDSTLIKLPDTIDQASLIQEITKLNDNPAIDGFIVQLPLPKHIDEETIINSINSSKDVDGFTPVNFGRMALGMDCYIPATPFGILQLLERNQIDTNGKHCVVIGRSNIVGKPISILLGLNNKIGNCTVTLVHSRTKDINHYIQQADIIVCALGKPNYLKGDMIKPGAVIIDVGITRVDDANNPKGYTIVGDVDFDSVKDKCSFITPVPGGVGPMTVAMLLQNTFLAYKRNHANHS